MEQSDIVDRLTEGAAHCGMCGAQAVEKNSRDQYICTACLYEVLPDYAHALRWEAAAEITRLRAALAVARAVGFAAGVEAAAKVLRVAVDECCITDDQGRIVDFMYDEFTSKSFASVRALTPPDATAAAARVLLGDDIQIARMAEAVHDGPLGADDHWFSAATKQGAWCVDVVRAALRAIAGDTP